MNSIVHLSNNFNFQQLYKLFLLLKITNQKKSKVQNLKVLIVLNL